MRLLLLIFLLAASLIPLYFWASTQRTQPVGISTTLIIPSGAGSKQILAQLEQAHIITYPPIHLAFLWHEGKLGALRAGEYRFAPPLTQAEALEKLVRGEVVQHKITIPGGLESAQIAAILNANPVLTGEIRAPIVEGSLLPETYIFTRGMTREGLLARMRRAQVAFLQRVWQHPLPTLKTPAEAVILASIIEKETGVRAERRRVSAVFHNRLRLGMKLQSDSTVSYGVVAAGAARPEPLLRVHLQQPTPYNTYTISGIPPAPICHPGMASLRAALDPADTDALYFVADGTGGHAFARTLTEHNRNVAAWRRGKVSSPR